MVSNVSMEEISKEVTTMEVPKEKSIFDILNEIDVNDRTEKKNGLTYLSWAWAWTEAKKRFPDANYTIYERDSEYGQINYFTDGKTCWVKTGVTINELEHIEQLPVMDYKNKSIPLNNVTSFDVNKAIQRSLTKALARHGLGLYIYAGEDLPESEKPKQEQPHEQRKGMTESERSTVINRINKSTEILQNTYHTDIKGEQFKNFIMEKVGINTLGVSSLSDVELTKYDVTLRKVIKMKEQANATQ